MHLVLEMASDYHLRRHPEGSADKSVPLRSGVRQLPGHTKVSELDVAHVGEQHVGSLDVSVQLPLLVQVVKPLDHLPQDDRDVLLLQAAGLHQVQGRAAAQVLHDDPKLGALEVGAEVFGDEGRVAL